MQTVDITFRARVNREGIGGVRRGDWFYWGPFEDFSDHSFLDKETFGFSVGKDKKGELIFTGQQVKRGKSIGEIRLEDNRLFIHWDKNPEDFNDVLHIQIPFCKVYEKPELLSSNTDTNE